MPDTRRQIVHLRREQTDFWRSALPSDCFIHCVAMEETEGSHVCRYRHFTPPDSCWNEYESISQSSAPCLCPQPPSTPPHPKLMTASPHLHPIMTRMLRQLKMFTPVAREKEGGKNPPCSTKWPVFTLMGLLIRVTLFMCVLNWRWAGAVVSEGDQPCLGQLNLMENLPTAFASSQSNRLETE